MGGEILKLPPHLGETLRTRAARGEMYIVVIDEIAVNSGILYTN